MNFAKKSLGQNFLIDKNIIRKIINLVKLEKKNIIEIGAGHGALTDEILKKKPNLYQICPIKYELTVGNSQEYFYKKFKMDKNSIISKIKK